MGSSGVALAVAQHKVHFVILMIIMASLTWWSACPKRASETHGVGPASDSKQCRKPTTTRAQNAHADPQGNHDTVLPTYR